LSPSALANASVAMSRSTSASAALESKSVERADEQVDRDREKYKDRDRNKDSNLSDLEISFKELYKQISESLSADDFLKFAEGMFKKSVYFGVGFTHECLYRRIYTCYKPIQSPISSSCESFQ